MWHQIEDPQFTVKEGNLRVTDLIEPVGPKFSVSTEIIIKATDSELLPEIKAMDLLECVMDREELYCYFSDDNPGLSFNAPPHSHITPGPFTLCSHSCSQYNNYTVAYTHLITPKKNHI